MTLWDTIGPSCNWPMPCGRCRGATCTLPCRYWWYLSRGTSCKLYLLYNSRYRGSRQAGETSYLFRMMLADYLRCLLLSIYRRGIFTNFHVPLSFY